eukprot:358554-Chlamydomonas_euryale.AAC.4
MGACSDHHMQSTTEASIAHPPDRRPVAPLSPTPPVWPPSARRLDRMQRRRSRRAADGLAGLWRDGDGRRIATGISNGLQSAPVARPFSFTAKVLHSPRASVPALPHSRERRGTQGRRGHSGGVLRLNTTECCRAHHGPSTCKLFLALSVAHAFVPPLPQTTYTCTPF